jgi:inorganic pyrophosphatase
VLCVLQTSKGKSKRNDRVFALPDRAPFEGDLQDIRHLPARAVKELEKFFEATDALEEKKITFLGWKGPTARPDRNESGFPRHAGGASLRH